MATALIDVIRGALLGIFWTAALFPAVLAAFWRWWETVLGVSIVIMDALIALAVSPTALHYMFRLNFAALWLLWYSAVVLGLIPLAIIWRAWVLWRVQRAPPDPARLAPRQPGRAHTIVAPRPRGTWHLIRSTSSETLLRRARTPRGQGGRQWHRN